MNNPVDFSFFKEMLGRVRRLKSHGWPWHIVRGAEETRTAEQPTSLPRMIVTPESEEGDLVFDTTSYATSPGHGLIKLQEMVGWPLPPDLVVFYELFEKALVVTRTHPLHIWPEDKILHLTREFYRDDYTKPLRVFRFGDYFDSETTQFGMRLEEPGTMKWRVFSTAVGCLDDIDDDHVDPDRILGPSFSEWLADWIARDGLPDPFMQLGQEGGYIDPVDE